jgi:hypothetical protein
MARTVGQPNKTGLIWVAVTCTLIINGQIFTISGTPGAHVASWVLIGCTVLLFVVAVASYLRKSKGSGSPPD